MIQQNLMGHHNLQLIVYKSENGRPRIDIDATLEVLGLTKDQITERRWSQQTVEGRVKAALNRRTA